ncbi:hypothetical protein DFH27DRAFT_631213 [Peziza echinospora]|nr:hypothetical protein DFH27DRAFT_631213 [Peziza echinospora]
MMRNSDSTIASTLQHYNNLFFHEAGYISSASNPSITFQILRAGALFSTAYIPIRHSTLDIFNIHNTPPKMAAGGWRPWPLQGWYMLLSTTLYLLLLLLSQLLIHFCTGPAGCPILGAPSPTQPSLTDRIVYQALPPAFAVLFSFVWLFIQHDIFRLEPFFQLSSGGGVLAEDSLLLQYGFVAPWEAAWTAWRRRHAVVMLAVGFGVVNSYGLGPIISGTFDQTMVVVERGVVGGGRGFAPVEAQEVWSAGVPENYTDGVFERVAHRRTLPAWATEEYVLAPVGGIGSEEGKGKGGNETLFAKTTLYEADLSCEAARSVVSAGPYTDNATAAWGGEIAEFWWSQNLRHVFHVYVEPPAGLALPSVRVTLCFVDRDYYMNANRLERDKNKGQPAIPPNDSPAFRTDRGNCTRVFMMEHSHTDSAPRTGNIGDWIGHSDVLADGTFWNLWMGGFDAEGTWTFNDTTPFDPKHAAAQATFCRPRYTAQEVVAAVDPTGAVVPHALERVGDRREWDGFQKGAFEDRFRYRFPRIASDGNEQSPTDAFRTQVLFDASAPAAPRHMQFGDASPGSAALVEVGRYAARTMCKPERRLDAGSMLESTDAPKRCAALPAKTLVTYAALLAEGHEDGAKLLRPDFAQARLRRTFRMLFAFAMAGAMAGARVEEAAAAPAVEVVRRAVYRGFRVNEAWVRVGQIVLGLCALMLGVLWAMERRRALALECDPGSIGEALHVLEGSPELRAQFEGAEFRSPRELRQALRAAGCRYRARPKPGGGMAVDVALPDASHRAGDAPAPRDRMWLKVSDWQLSRLYGVLLALLTAALALCVFLAYYYARRLNGLPTLGSTRSLRYKLLYTYTPFLLSSSLGPILVGLCSVHCVIAPFDLLQRRQRAPSATILTTDFDRRPPQMQLFSALRFRQLTIAGLCIAFAAANVLTVTMASLFSPFVRDATVGGVAMNVTALPVFDYPNVVPGVVISAFLENITNANTETTTWTTPAFYIVPFAPANLTAATAGGTNLTSAPPKSFTGRTLAIGIDVLCQPMAVVPKTGEDPSSTSGWGALSIKDAMRPEATRFLDWGTYHHGAYPYDQWANYTNPARNIPQIRAAPTTEMEFVWWEFPFDPALTPPYARELAILGVNCNLTARAAHVTATVDHATHKVLRTTDHDFLGAADTERLFNAYMNIAVQGATTAVGMLKEIMHRALVSADTGLAGCPASFCLVNYLLKRANPKTSARPRGVDTFLPARAEIYGSLEDLVRRMTVVGLKLYSSPNATSTEPAWEVTSGSGSGSSNNIVISVERVGVNAPMFYASIGLLAYLLLVLLYRVAKHHTMQGHVPTSLAGVYALIYAAEGVVDHAMPCGTGRERKRAFTAGALGFGEFVRCSVGVAGAVAGTGRAGYGVYVERPQVKKVGGSISGSEGAVVAVVGPASPLLPQQQQHTTHTTPQQRHQERILSEVASFVSTSTIDVGDDADDDVVGGSGRPHDHDRFSYEYEGYIDEEEYARL